MSTSSSVDKKDNQFAKKKYSVSKTDHDVTGNEEDEL